jgi:hypothetical protein
MGALFSPDRHEPLVARAWDEGLARATVERIARDTEAAFTPEGLWPTHPRDAKDPAPAYMLYCGAAGTIWGLEWLRARGAIDALRHDYAPHVLPLLAPNRLANELDAAAPFASYLIGDTGIRLLHLALTPDAATDDLAQLIAGNLDNPTREMMWGSPGTMMAALFLHRRTGEPRFADLYRATAAKLWSQLEWSEAEQCRFWSQDMYGEHTGYLDAVHGFAGTAVPLIAGRDLLPPGDWDRWRTCIADTIRRTAEWDGPLVNWRARIESARGRLKLVQYCHGAPGFVITLGDWPDDGLDDLLRAGAETTWAAGPLDKGPQLCHGTGGNGYAFLKLYERTGDARWLERARAFAMHGIRQVANDEREYGQLRYSLWTGDPGFAIYLWDCIRARAAFPTLDVFYV